MRKITFSQATQEAMAETMAKDPTVFAMGEDLSLIHIFGVFCCLCCCHRKNSLLPTLLSALFEICWDRCAGR